MNIKILLLFCYLFSSVSYAQVPKKSSAEAAIGSAQILWNKTKVAGHEWSMIKTLISQAEQAINKHDLITAITLAKKAAELSELALVQAKNEKTNWINSLPKE